MFIQLKTILKKRLKRLGSPEKIELGLIQNKWLKILKELAESENIDAKINIIFQESFPYQLKDGTLRIKVGSDGAATEFSLLGEELMAKINQEIGRRAVKKLFFKIKND